MSPPDATRPGGAGSRIFDPTPFRDRARRTQIVLAGVIPASTGAVAGVLVGASSGAYWAYSVLVSIGAVFAGFEHRGARDGARRGLVAGLIYGIALLVVHAIAGTHAKVSLGSFPPLLAVLTAVAGMLLSGLGGWIAAQQRGRRNRAG
jgi:hypothetical protein